MKYLRGKRWRVILGATGLAMGVCLSLLPPPGTPSKPSAAYRATEHALTYRWMNVAGDSASLGSVLKQIERDVGVEIIVDAAAVAEGEIDLALTVPTESLPARKALEAMLREAGGEAAAVLH